MTNVMLIPMRVQARSLQLGDVIEGLPVIDLADGGVNWLVTREPAHLTPKLYRADQWIDVKRPTEGRVPCPECGDPMSDRRLEERALEITKGVCSECVSYPRRHALQVARERAIAAFGEGRC